MDTANIALASESRDQVDEIVGLFTSTFTASEGAEEGALIGALVRDMLATTPEDSLFVFSARENGVLLGCILFSRVTYAEDDRSVFILSPAAVATNRQGEGIGQALIRFGLRRLRESGVDVALTYGDPDFYGRVGFAQITQEQAAAPLPLSHPEGWLGQALGEKTLGRLAGSSRCVEALDQPHFW